MRRSVLVLGALLAVMVGAKPALPWGSAVHAYVDAQLGARGLPQKDLIYGGMVPDAFTMLFEDPAAMQYLYAVTHGLTPSQEATVLPLFTGVETRRERNFALGFYSHNNVNAADQTAHGYPYNDPPYGYVVAKAHVLREILRGPIAQAGLALPEDVLLEVSHILVEYAADLLIRDVDRSIGASMIAAAAARSDAFPDLLAATYGPGLAAYLHVDPAQAEDLIIQEEAQFRGMISVYGAALQRGDKKVLAVVVGFLAGVAQDYLGMFGVEATDEQVIPLVHFGVAVAMNLCRADLMPAVEDTIEQVAKVTAPLW